MSDLQVMDHLDGFGFHCGTCHLELIPSGSTWSIQHTCSDWFVLTIMSQRISLHGICFSYFG